MKWDRLLVVPLAIVLDIAVGDPPNRYHPVAWMGRGISMAQCFAPKNYPLAEFVFGGLISITGAGVLATVGRFISSWGRSIPTVFSVLSEAFVLKSTFTIRGLTQAAVEVHHSLQQNDLLEARRALSWHLVSRDTSFLNESQVAAAAIESVAENASDGVVAPLIAYSIGGLPAALVYRFLNTTDSMLGYRDPAREWLGKIPARLDDVMNLIPARLTGALIALCAGLANGSSRHAWRVMRRDARTTASPNAGYPMSAMAGALGVELIKVDHYHLGAGQRKPTPVDLQKSIKVLGWVSFLTVLLAEVLILSRISTNRKKVR